jgi:DNA polymerase III sliding clamp (beta) subunit (PCNA family)
MDESFLSKKKNYFQQKMPLISQVRFSGSPPFAHRLTLNGVEVSQDSQSIRLVDFDDHTLITIPELHSAQSGRYEYTISNGGSFFRTLHV